MTDKQIIESLELCYTNDICESNCEKCPFETYDSLCMGVLFESVIDLIKRQQAEIERLQSKLINSTHIHVDKSAFEECCYNIETAKAEAYKEFAERLKEIYAIHEGLHMEIDNLVKELTEGSNGVR